MERSQADLDGIVASVCVLVCVALISATIMVCSLDASHWWTIFPAAVGGLAMGVWLRLPGRK